ncbi:hypothetical protein P7C73_g1568, partial [Tremellales sp. Uapishka_1]
MSRPEPSIEDQEEFLLSCRYGELEEVTAYTEKYGWASVGGIKDDRGSTVLHMVCANGHVDILNLLLPHVPSSLLSQPNSADTPPLHWAILNNQVDIVKALAEWPEASGGGLPLFKQKNKAGRDAFAQSVWAGEGKEEVSGWIEGYLYRAEGGEEEDRLDAEAAKAEAEAEVRVESGDEVVKEESEAVEEIVEKTGVLAVKSE